MTHEEFCKQHPQPDLELTLRNYHTRITGKADKPNHWVPFSEVLIRAAVELERRAATIATLERECERLAKALSHAATPLVQPVSPEMLELARRAVQQAGKRTVKTAAEIDAWATRLAHDLCAACEADPPTTMVPALGITDAATIPPDVPPSTTVVLDCGCTRTRGWRCPVHSDP